MTSIQLSQQEIVAEQISFIQKVYAWMSGALIITALVAMWTAQTTSVVEIVIGNPLIFWGILILQLVCVTSLSAFVGRLSSKTATLIFIGYAALNGLTFAAIFLIFTSESIATTFFVTAGTFGIMSAYGYFTKRDLTTVGNIAFMGLIGLVLASVVNFFLASDILHWITTFIGIIIFVALTAYHTQKIKDMNIIGNEGTEEDKKEAIMGALTLYLDFINLFMFLLRIFGRRK